MPDILTIGDRSFKPGERGQVDLAVGQLVTHGELKMRVHVFRASQPGPRLFVSGAIHGDEINGVEIAHQLLRTRHVKLTCGDLIVVPVVNVPGFIIRSRYLPDRRDLNRLFPGSSEGSSGARIARAFFREVVRGCTHGIDLHTGAAGRTNLPQTRICSEVPGSREIARAFGAPVMLESAVREGSLRAALSDRELPLVLFEAGEAGRLDPAAVRFGLRGVISVMRHLKMIPPSAKPGQPHRVTYCSESYWVRSPAGGIFRALIPLGKAAPEDQKIGAIADPLSKVETVVRNPAAGVIIGRSNQALVDEGDALYHIACTDDHDRAERRIEASGRALLGDIEETLYDDRAPVDSAPD